MIARGEFEWKDGVYWSRFNRFIRDWFGNLDQFSVLGKQELEWGIGNKEQLTTRSVGGNKG